MYILVLLFWGRLKLEPEKQLHCVGCGPLQILQKKFTDFVHNTMASEERVTNVCKMADDLIEAKHTGEPMHTDFVIASLGHNYERMWCVLEW